MKELKKKFAVPAARAALTLVILLATAMPALAGGDETRLRARLSGPRISPTDVMTPSGDADFRHRPQRGRTKLNVDVEDIALPAGTRLVVTIGGVTLAQQIVVDAFGFGEITLDTDLGGNPPTGVQANDVVVIQIAGGAAILSGIMGVR